MAAAKKKTPAKKAEPQDEPKLITYKGFDSNLACRGFQYALGESYEHKGAVEACNSGFHACEYPLDIFAYYPPAGSRFCAVEQSGTLTRHADDSKIASSKISIKAELNLSGIIKAAIEYTFSRSKPEGEMATGDQGAALATGHQGAASATGYRGAALASGWRGQARGAAGNALFLVERDSAENILNVWAGIAGKDGIRADTWYTLTDGVPVEVQP